MNQALNASVFYDVDIHMRDVVYGRAVNPAIMVGEQSMANFMRLQHDGDILRQIRP
ncbi:MAG: hypothetical protein DDT34_01942 [Firmicutes bacterium]|nr:hypothetical protein [Bacillota bacterium]